VNLNESSQRTVRLSSNAIEYLGAMRGLLLFAFRFFFPPLREISFRALMFHAKAQRKTQDAKIIRLNDTQAAHTLPNKSA
jgi:hypothetical protein